MSFDPRERSEFFWVHDSGISYETVLLYSFFGSGREMPQTVARSLREATSRGVRILGKGPGLRDWHPTAKVVKYLLRAICRLTWAALRSVARGKRFSYHELATLVGLACEHAYWLDFFDSNNVRVNVGTLNTSVSQTLALDTLGGVSIAYQYSASNILLPTLLLTSGENIQFTFSEAFGTLWESLKAPIEYIATSGFIYDSAFAAIRESGYGKSVRSQLQAAGAEFVLCFFDENSSDRWDICASNTAARHDYEFLLNWLLEDPSLGIVFKPKAALTLLSRTRGIEALLERAKRTGRCAVLHSDFVVGNTYPAEAAGMADVCIGKLIGCTAALEARLFGVRTILIDTEKLASHRFRDWDDGHVVFDDWKSLRCAVERYRSKPEEYPRFGDWSPWLRELDPFQDGRAAQRLGLFVSWLQDELSQGATRSSAIDKATEKYAQMWGEDSIRRCCSTRDG